MSVSQYPSLIVNGGELNWAAPDKDSTFDQTKIYKSDAKYGTYSLLATITTIRTLYYIDSAVTSAAWYKVQFVDSDNTLTSQFSLPKSATGRISDTNYTTPRKVVEFIGAFRRKVDESIGTADGTETEFSFTSGDNQVVQETEYIYDDGTLADRNLDYTINFDLGKVVFATAPTDTHAMTASWWSLSFGSNELIIDSIKRAEDEIYRRLGRTFYEPEAITVYIDSYDPVDSTPFAYEQSNYVTEAATFEPNFTDTLKRRTIRLKKYPIVSINQIILNSQPTEITSEAIGTAIAAQTDFSLDNAIIVYGTDTIYLDGVETTAYTISLSAGTIVFDSAPGAGVVVTGDYTHCKDGTIISSDDYLVREEAGLIFLKSSATTINQNPFVMAVSYVTGFYDIPPQIKKLATRIAAVDLIQTTQMSPDTSLSLTNANIGAMLGEIRSIYKTMGEKFTMDRI